MEITNKSKPVTRQEYYLAFNSSYQIKVTCKIVFDLLKAGIAKIVKDKIINKANDCYRLIKIKLINHIFNECSVYHNVTFDEITIIRLQELQEIAPLNVARDLQSFLGKMIRKHALFNC